MTVFFFFILFLNFLVSYILSLSAKMVMYLLCFLVLMDNRNLHLEAGKSKVKVPANSVSGEELLPGSETDVFSLCPHMAEGEQESSLARH